jgi:hypothetical protein
MDVALRRKKLAEIRQKFSNQTAEEPFTLSAPLSTGEIISDFVVTVALGIHSKRTIRSKSPQLKEHSTKSD